MPTVKVAPNLAAWASQLDRDDVIIIVGSGKTPHADVRRDLTRFPQRTVYLEPGDERSTRWSTERYMPLNDHCRHALALLEAMTYDPRYVLSLDDDNFPDTVFTVKDMINMMAETGSKPITESSNGWFNVGAMCDPSVIHRGYPLSRRNTGARLFADTHEHPDAELPVGVFAALWRGDPDIDAVERIAVDPFVNEVDGTAWLATNTWCPFNTQSTMWRNELSPLLLMWPYVGRYDDIWASYVARAWMQANGWLQSAGNPVVRQDRNPHDLIHDLENELLGYRYTDHVVSVVRDMVDELKGVNAARATALMFAQLAASIPADGNHRWLPTQTIQAFKAWSSDLHRIQAGEMKWEDK